MKMSQWFKGKRRLTLLCALSVVAVLTISACIRPIDTTTEETAALDRSALTGEELFSQPFPGAKNQRSCATCHVPADNFTLTPAHVARLLAENPNDPLFSAIDADDPNANPLTFEHLKKGLVRVWLTLPDNMDLIDEAGNVITPADRKIFVWRGVPSIADTFMTAPYQLDGRQLSLESQAQSAITSHSEGVEIPASELTRIADFERATFTSELARYVATVQSSGTDPGLMPDVTEAPELTEQEARGMEVFNAVCAACHGGANAATILNREVHDLAFAALRPDGTVIYEVPATDPPTLVLAAQPENEFLNIGSAYQAMQGQFDPDSSSFTKDVSFPNYRYRFYTDGSRTAIAADLPPAAPPLDGVGPDGAGFDGAGGGDDIANALFSELDSDGNPVLGPNLALQFFSTDPGRAAITGNPYDFEAFDVQTLRGIGRTAPYFHNNTAETLEKVVDLYSDHFLARFPSLALSGEKELDADGDIGPPEALTPQQKEDLIAFLKRL